MSFALLPAALVLAGALFVAVYALYVLRPRRGTLDWIALEQDKPFTFAVRRHPMERKDALPVLLLTAAYALTAFFSLGSLTAPQQSVDLAGGKSLTFQVEGEAIRPQRIWSYAALGTGSYNLEISTDAKNWSTLWTRTELDQWDREQTVYYWAAPGYRSSYALPQTYNHVFKWTETQLDNPMPIQYIRITGRADKGLLQLGKLIFRDENDQPISWRWTLKDGDQPSPALAQLFAVDNTVPDAISWRNSGYFDEIYHPRTALEHIQGVYPYEITHPPLGKLIQGLGIRMFGMVPFGWRFMGTLFGVLMVPLVYLFLKNIFGKRKLAVCGTALFASGFMHLTQTRIATIDTYGVFFVLLTYLFFYRWLTAPATPKKNGRVTEGYGQLALSGLFWGIGCACKWTVIYAGAGLAVLYLIHMVTRIRQWDRSEGGARLGPWLCKTLVVSVLFFVLVPVAVYTASYLPYAQAAGKPGLQGVLDEMWRNQGYMLSYHSGVHSPHPYSSRWYQWLVDGRPILYYYKDLPDGGVEKFAALTNPLTTWLGLAAIVGSMARCCKRMWAKLTVVWSTGLGCCLVCWLVGRVENGDFDPALSAQALGRRFLLMVGCLAVYLALSTLIALATEGRRSALDVFITVGFAAQFVPWVFIGRTTFAYHYFPATLFLLLALCALFDQLMDCPRAKWRLPLYGVTAASVGLYLLFYPYLTGLPMSKGYFANLLRFLPSWP